MKVYGRYLDGWLSGMDSEIAFWDEYMKTRGSVYFVNWEWQVSPGRQFELENDIPENMRGKKYTILDVGSGPFSRLGKKTNKVNLDMQCVDPLGFAYDFLKKKYNVDTGVSLMTGFVEMLDRVVPADSFDLVHMSNSLDHSFDPLLGIRQLLRACKVGGKVILRHAENEAVRGNYGGLHQWNLSLDNPEHSFIIWRNDKRIDVCKLFADYADIEMYPDELESRGWKHNKVVFIKRKDTPSPQPQEQHSYYEVMLEYVYRKLLETLLKNIELTTNPRQEKINKLMKLIAETYQEKREKLVKWLNNNGNSIVIYGAGGLGQALYTLLQKCGANIVAVIDRQPISFMEQYANNPKQVNAIHPNDYNWDGESTIVVTPIGETEEVIQWALYKTNQNKSKVASIGDFLSQM